MLPDSIFRSTIRLRGVSKEFVAGAGTCMAGVRALDDVSVEIRGGEALFICGPPGAGKTTLLVCAAGLLHCDSGMVDGATRRRILYRDLRSRPLLTTDWPAAGVILLDSCDDVGELARARAAHGLAKALSTGSAVVLASREPESAFALVPMSTTVSVVHLRLGRIAGGHEAGQVHRVAEKAGGGY